MSDTPANTPKRRKIVTADIADDGADMVLSLHGPVDSDGKFPVVDSLTFNETSIHSDLVRWFAMNGVKDILSNIWNRPDEDATPQSIRASLQKVLDAITDGSWEPGRSFVERDPTDLELAIAEATGQSVSAVIDRIENEYERDEHGELKLDKAGRKSRVFNKRMLDALANDVKIKPILARLTEERAKRLKAEAKSGGGRDLLGSIFGSVEPAAQDVAAN